MEITITLDHGPLDIEFTGQDREDLQKELLGFKQFLEENDEIFDFEVSSLSKDGGSSRQETFDSAVEDPTPERGVDYEIRNALSPIARATGLAESELSKHLYVDPDGEHDPEILINDPDDVFGTTKKAKQKPASLILLYLWSKCYDDKDQVNSSELKDALAGSGIDPSSLFNIYDNDFHKKGPNNNILELSRSGQLRAQEEIEKLVEKGE